MNDLLKYNSNSYASAAQDFQEARRKATIEEILAKIQGKSASLIPYDEVRNKLGGIEKSGQILKDIPLDAIVGSVGRYTDFSRSFLPLKEYDQERWARVKIANDDFPGLPPINVYQIGDYYFVLDGHHRISVARQSGSKSIQAYVTQLISNMPFSLDDKPDEVIIQEEKRYFEDQTKFTLFLPGKEIKVSIPGQYQQLVEHISVHRYLMGIDQQRGTSLKESVIHWYKEIYQPVVNIIQNRDILKYFPGRSEADLYLWIMKYRLEIEEEIGWKIDTRAVVEEYSQKFSTKILSKIIRKIKKLLELIAFEEFIQGPEPGEWREEHDMDAQENYEKSNNLDPHIFRRILVAMDNTPASWIAFKGAISIAKNENALLSGLHVVKSMNNEKTPSVKKFQKEFTSKCEENGLQGSLSIASGDISSVICERARWTDLVVIKMAYPPPLNIVPRLGSGFRKIIKKCPTPILAIPYDLNKIENILLAFDGSKRAKEALYIATYLSGSWNAKLFVIMALKNNNQDGGNLVFAEEYLKFHNIDYGILKKYGYPPDIILKTTLEKNVDLIIMGGYGSKTWKEIFLGSTVDRVLQATSKPVLICK